MRNRLDQAIEWATRTLAIRPDFVKAQIHLGLAWSQKGAARSRHRGLHVGAGQRPEHGGVRGPSRWRRCTTTSAWRCCKPVTKPRPSRTSVRRWRSSRVP